MKWILRLFMFLFIAIGAFGISLLTYQGFWPMALGLALVYFLTIFIFVKKSAYPFRFMYPGLITFFFFLVLPIIFTVWIGFTNLGTGHLLNKAEVKKILAEESYEVEEAQARNLPYVLLGNEGGLEIFAKEEKTQKTYHAIFKMSDKEVSLQETSQAMPGEGMPKGVLFKTFRELKDHVLVLPDGEKLRFQRMDALVNVKTRFKDMGEDQFLDLRTQVIYKADEKTGFFVNQNDPSDKLSPGYYVMVGGLNFTRLFSDSSVRDTFARIFFWTMLWSLGSVLLSFTMGMTLALVVNHKALKMKALYRVLLIIPYSIPFFISVLIFKGLLNQDFGIVNEILASFGMAKINWLGDPLIAKLSCLMVNLWLGFPYMFLVTTGILQSIPSSVYEAAAMDGAKRFATFRHITLPMTFSAIGPLLVGSFAFNLNNFVGIYLLTGGGPPFADATTPAGSTDILISYTYRLAFEGGSGQDFGLASSIAMIIFVIITILTLINFKLSGMFKKESK